MAAARIKWIAPAALLDQLKQRLPELTGATRDRSPRQHTLRGAIDWSYDLLTNVERDVFNLCGVFSGGFDVEAARAVTNRSDTASVLQALVEKSLLTYESDSNGAARYAMLEMIREYAREKLGAREQHSAQGQLADACQRHAAYYLIAAEQARRSFNGPDEQQALERLEHEHDNLRAALDWTGEQPNGDEFVRLVCALAQFWLVRGHWTEGRRWTDRAVMRTASFTMTEDQPRWRANALYVSAQLIENHSEPEVVRTRYEESLQLRRAFNDTTGVAEALSGLGRVASNQGDYARARAYFEESIELFRQVDQRTGLATTLNNLGFVAYIQQGEVEARKLCEESLALRRAAGDRRGVATALNSLGYMAIMRGDYATARQHYEESLALRRQLGDRNGISRSLNNLGVVASDQANYVAARRYYVEGLALDRELGDRRGVAITIINLGNVAYNLGQWATARTHYDEALAILEELNDQRNIAVTLNSLGNVALKQGDSIAARQFIQHSLTRRLELGDRRGLVHTLVSMTAWLSTFGSSEQAARLAGAVDSLHAALKVHFDVPEQAWFGEIVAGMQAKLDNAAFKAAWTQGQAWSLEEACACKRRLSVRLPLRKESAG